MDSSPPGSSGKNTGVGCHFHLQGIFWPKNQAYVSFIAGGSFTIEPLGRSFCSLSRVISSANSNSFTFPLPMWLLFIYFPCLIAMTRISNTVLNRSGESVHPCLLLHLAWGLSAFHHWLSCWLGLWWMPFIMLRYFPSIPTLLRIFSWMYLEFC